MNISEREIFNFVFFPEILAREKFLFLSNTEFFENEINLLKYIKGKYRENLSQDIIEKIRNKIVELSNNRTIKLEKKKNPSQNNSNQIVLAADSHLKNEKQRIETFEDSNSNYLIKVLYKEASTKVYLFTRDNKECTNLKINVEPSGKNYTFENSNDPIIISDNLQITGITIITPN